MLQYDPGAAVSHLKTRDRTLARMIDQVGPFTLEPRDGAFRQLSRAIFFQQLAGPAARAILRRVLDVLGANEEGWYTPERLLAADDERLRAAGLSRQKLLYLRDLAEKFASGALRDDELAALDDEEVVRRVSSVRGIGRWTAEMLLIFSLGRPHVLPVDDLGARRAMKTAYRLPDLPEPDEMRAIAEPWRPYRSVGTWYMWRSLGVTLPEQGGMRD
jgi:3-methyladenine DNA glycosylase/8-oxoguanine DNA glycosylase